MIYQLLEPIGNYTHFRPIECQLGTGEQSELYEDENSSSMLHLYGEFLQVRESEMTNGFVGWVNPRQLGNAQKPKMYSSKDMFGVQVAKAESQVGFSQRQKVKSYTTEQFKIFIRNWVKCDQEVHLVAKELGITENKVTSIVRYLKKLGVRIQTKGLKKRRKKRKIDWLTFVRAIKGAKFIETACEMLDLKWEHLVMACKYLQKQGVKIVIPPFDNNPEWVQIRMGRELKQQIYISSLHGSGRKYKQRWANYRKQIKVNKTGMELFVR